MLISINQLGQILPLICIRSSSDNSKHQFYASFMVYTPVLVSQALSFRHLTTALKSRTLAFRYITRVTRSKPPMFMSQKVKAMLNTIFQMSNNSSIELNTCFYTYITKICGSYTSVHVSKYICQWFEGVKHYLLDV